MFLDTGRCSDLLNSTSLFKPKRWGRLVPILSQLRLVMQDCTQQRIVNLELSVAVDETKLAKLVHKKAHAGPSGAVGPWLPWRTEESSPDV
jgi:hypothetical protein